MHKRNRTSGFTIVELLIVIVIIGILATVVVVAYNGITRKAQDATLQSDLRNASMTLEVANATDGNYPGNGDSLRFSPNTNLDYSYTASDNSYCLAASSTKTNSVYHIRSGGSISSGGCYAPIVAGMNIQDITNANCPMADKIRAKDARDNHTYWVQKLSDGRCWMLTNLAYAGGTSNSGISAYGDTISGLLKNNPGNSLTDTIPVYYEPVNANPTIEPDDPSTSTDGGVTNPQYGYLYNWCAAMGAQTGTNTCSASSSVDDWDHAKSICPSGWRLPTGGVGGEFMGLNATMGTSEDFTDNIFWGSALYLSEPFMVQLAGVFGPLKNGSPNFAWSGQSGDLWTSSIESSTSSYLLGIGNPIYEDESPQVFPASSDVTNYGRSVRCVTGD